MVWRALDGIDDLMLAGTCDNSSRTVSIQKDYENYKTFYNINLIQYSDIAALIFINTREKNYLLLHKRMQHVMQIIQFYDLSA